MPRPSAALWIAVAAAALLYRSAAAQYSSDLCSWRGSGLSHESHRRDVEQIYLRCSQGSLEWLYPTGAIIVHLRPNTEPPTGQAAELHVCIKPHPRSQGSNVYLERGGELRLLLAEGEQADEGPAVRCFSREEGALFVEAVPQTDISRKTTAFQYELVRGHGAGVYPYLHTGPDTCEPCSDDEVLMAVCTSDFAGSGVFRSEVPGDEAPRLAAVSLSRLFRQKSGVFSWGGVRARRWSGRLSVPAGCGVRHGEEEYLFTGAVRFGEAWLGCAPRYKDFLQLYGRAQRAGTNPCHIDTD